MKIKVEVEIFDDPEYCKNEFEECEYLDKMHHITRVDSCNLFNVTVKNSGGLKIKCPQCKEAYQKAKEIENRPFWSCTAKQCDARVDECTNLQSSKQPTMCLIGPHEVGWESKQQR